jgi:N-acetylglucosaminyldiphosphoundecaprenol N-acetyl-beta-D-mannosaminyltransferase
VKDVQREEQRSRVDILGCLVDRVTMHEALTRIEGFLAQGAPRQVITLNAEIIVAAQTQPALREVINRADLVTPDGAGVVWAARQLGKGVPERVTGIDLTQALAHRAAQRGWSLFLLGARPGVAEKAARKLQSRYPGLRVKGVRHGYFQASEEAEVVAAVAAADPDIVLVALGAPRQEFWIHRHLQELRAPVCIGVGGSLDVIAGEVPRAPAFMIRHNLEWLYRLWREPSRWKRQKALPVFVVRVLGAKGRGRGGLG